MARRPLVAGNWKMHGSAAQLAEFARDFGAAPASADVMIAPVAPYIGAAVTAFARTGVMVGAQNVHAEPSGAYTGECAASMVADVGATHVIVGHSERRAMFAETDAVVAAKFAAVAQAGLTPVLCVGEPLDVRQADRQNGYVIAQVQAVIDALGASQMSGCVIAYEPVWAIGTGEAATPEQAQQMHAVIRTLLSSADTALGAQTRLLYGGSIKADNAAELFSQADIDGGLVGGASLEAGSFRQICEATGT